MKEQNFKNHMRFDPPFHFFLLPMFLLNLVFCIAHAFRHPGPFDDWMAVMALVLMFFALLMRMYAMKNQDRIIRLEERLRLERLCSEPLRARVPQLTARQLIGLRFASDAELAALAQRALDEKLSEKDIKAAVKNWRADYSRA